MTLTVIVQKIERRARSRSIGHLQETRRELKGRPRVGTHSIFTAQTICEKREYPSVLSQALLTVARLHEQLHRAILPVCA